MLLAAILAIGTANAQPSHFGAGAIIGDPTGVSLGWRPTEWNAVELGLGWDLLDGQFKTTADYLQSVAVIDPNAAVRIPIYVGLGAGVGSDLGTDLGGGFRPVETPGVDVGTQVAARAPVGASVLLMNAPLEFFAHVIPALRVLPDVQFEVDGALGVRYYF
ncbi:MAG: hypothetical protein Q8P41_17115 [Pseudomonadota bacterium]|nr:hypothetical protein [Pseudomonadota bacterium]